MDNTLYVGLSHQMAMRRHMDVVANNLANMNTTAFKRESVLFQEYLKSTNSTAPGSSEDIAFVFDFGVARNYTAGALIETGNPLDLAVTDRGFLAVQGEDGEIFYTRNGHLSLGQDGALVTPSGYPILDVDGNEIIITEDDRSLIIAPDGTISSTAGEIAQIQLVEFAPEDEQFLRKAGDSLFETEVQPQPAVKARILQRMVEGSNVEPIKEMVQMMSISRAYQQTAKMMEQYQDMYNRSVERIGKVQ